jgi:hypothetical protein
MNKPAEKPSSESPPQTASGAPTREEIELRAYQIYVERGGAHGFEARICENKTCARCARAHLPLCSHAQESVV